MKRLPVASAPLDALRFPSNEAISLAITKMIPKHQWDRFHKMNPDAWAEIEPEFLGFLNIYWALSHLIPTHWTIVDVGAAFGVQAVLFSNHRRYLIIEPSKDLVPYSTHNSTHYAMNCGEFLSRHGHELDPQETFAICSYCPMWGERTTQHLRAYFPNLFVYYPHGQPSPLSTHQTKLKATRSPVQS